MDYICLLSTSIITAMGIFIAMWTPWSRILEVL